jgi:tRNA(fMet)-specific endonuclease VapC
MTGYLLDTNVVSYWFDPASREQHQAVARRIDGLPEDALMTISAITLGEIEYGHRALGEEIDREKEDAFLQFIEHRLPMTLDVGKHTRLAYGSLRARLFDQYAPSPRKGLRPEQLVDPVTARGLGIHENDLWIASQALEHNLVLVTHDRMTHLKEVAGELRLEDWASPF